MRFLAVQRPIASKQGRPQPGKQVTARIESQAAPAPQKVAGETCESCELASQATAMPEAIYHRLRFRLIQLLFLLTGAEPTASQAARKQEHAKSSAPKLATSSTRQAKSAPAPALDSKALAAPVRGTSKAQRATKTEHIQSPQHDKSQDRYGPLSRNVPLAVGPSCCDSLLKCQLLPAALHTNAAASRMLSSTGILRLVCK